MNSFGSDNNPDLERWVRKYVMKRLPLKGWDEAGDLIAEFSVKFEDGQVVVHPCRDYMLFCHDGVRIGVNIHQMHK